MDDDVIDVSHMTKSEYRKYMRHVEQIASCPCTQCTRICDRWSIVAECEPYQLWLEYQQGRKR